MSATAIASSSEAAVMVIPSDGMKYCSATGSTTEGASPTDKLIVSLDTHVNPTTVGTEISGPMADFNPSQPYTWPAVTWAGTYSGPTDVAALDAATSFDASGFLNPDAGTFGWSLDPAGQTLSLV